MEYTKIISLKFTASEYSKLEELIKSTHKNRSEFIRDRIFGDTVGDTGDTGILMKMIPHFIEYGIKLDTTTEMEDKRLMELIEKCQ